MPSDAATKHQPEIIRAVNGMTDTGKWFVVALTPHHSGCGLPSMTDAPGETDDCLVVLGWRERDIIALRRPGARAWRAEAEK